MNFECSMEKLEVNLLQNQLDLNFGFKLTAIALFGDTSKHRLQIYFCCCLAFPFMHVFLCTIFNIQKSRRLGDYDFIDSVLSKYPSKPRPEDNTVNILGISRPVEFLNKFQFFLTYVYSSSYFSSHLFFKYALWAVHFISEEINI